MEEIFDKVKKHAVRAKDEATKLGKQVYEKTNTAIGKAKISFAIGETDSKIKEIYAQIGNLIYEEYCKGNVLEAVKDSCEKIDELVKEKEELRDKLAELRETVKCSECGKSNEADAAYCTKCGAKVNKKNGDIEYTDTPVAEYSEDIDHSYSEDDTVVTIKAKKPEEE